MYWFCKSRECLPRDTQLLVGGSGALGQPPLQVWEVSASPLEGHPPAERPPGPSSSRFDGAALQRCPEMPQKVSASPVVITHQGSWPSPISRDWQRSDKRFRRGDFTGGPCCSRREWEQTVGSFARSLRGWWGCSFYGVRVRVGPEVGPKG